MTCQRVHPPPPSARPTDHHLQPCAPRWRSSCLLPQTGASATPLLPPPGDAPPCAKSAFLLPPPSVVRRRQATRPAARSSTRSLWADVSPGHLHPALPWLQPHAPPLPALARAPSTARPDPSPPPPRGCHRRSSNTGRSRHLPAQPNPRPRACPSTSPSLLGASGHCWSSLLPSVVLQFLVSESCSALVLK